ncbi:hypothetical protein DFH28DRAFT_910371 [Melampsora americana]|nr:hypothetical protein DFH28DRAFT_915209 [Melampsora americana]KAH9808283.1 hypothetical protein DFH28DRAFT_910371 [Melampsora americana]
MSDSFSHESPFPSIPDFIGTEEEEPRSVREQYLENATLLGMDGNKKLYVYSQPCSRCRNAKDVRLCVTGSRKSSKCERRGRTFRRPLSPSPERPAAQDSRRAGKSSFLRFGLDLFDSNISSINIPKMEMPSLVQNDLQEHGGMRPKVLPEAGKARQVLTQVAGRIEKWHSNIKPAGTDCSLDGESHGTSDLPRKREREDEFIIQEGNLHSPVKKMTIQAQVSVGEQRKDQARTKLFIEGKSAQRIREEANQDLEEDKNSDATSDVWGEAIPSPSDGKFMLANLKKQAKEVEKFIAKKTKDIAGLIPKGNNSTSFVSIRKDMRNEFKAHKEKVRLVVKPLESQ